MVSSHHFARISADPHRSSQDFVIQWLASQQQVLSIWLEHIDNLTSADKTLIAALTEHHRWLSDILPSLHGENAIRPLDVADRV